MKAQTIEDLSVGFDTIKDVVENGMGPPEGVTPLRGERLHPPDEQSRNGDGCMRRACIKNKIAMKYTPKRFREQRLLEKSPEEAGALTRPVIIRRLHVREFEVGDDFLTITTRQLALPLRIAKDKKMAFGSETVTATEYFRRVIERDDVIDAVVLPPDGTAFPVECYWIHIAYVGDPAQAGPFSQKDDGLFALRTKAGEKGERIATKSLRDKFGHSFPEGMYRSPGYFEIRYAGKKERKPDRRCLTCGLTFEIKKRNRDKHLRVSHSRARPFESENSRDGWHAFVFCDMVPRFVSNAAIAQAISEGKDKPGQDRYDRWTDVDDSCHAIRRAVFQLILRRTILRREAVSWGDQTVPDRGPRAFLEFHVQSSIVVSVRISPCRHLACGIQW